MNDEEDLNSTADRSIYQIRNESIYKIHFELVSRMHRGRAQSDRHAQHKPNSKHIVISL